MSTWAHNAAVTASSSRVKLRHLDVSVIAFTLRIYIFPTTVVSFVLRRGLYPFSFQAVDQLVYMLQYRTVPVLLS